MTKNSMHLIRRLHQSGYSDKAITAAWPSWWSQEAESSDSAQIELRFSLARKLGLDPRYLLEDDEPNFVWKGGAKFKTLRSETNDERDAVTSYGLSVGRVLVSATKEIFPFEGTDAREVRSRILENNQFVSLHGLLVLCWSFGIPVIHLRVFPLKAKRMCAMTIRIDDRFAILLGKDANYPAPITFYLAHELGHIALGHLSDSSAIVDVADPLKLKNKEDVEEKTADHYALELLTGMKQPRIDTKTRRFTAMQLADNLLQTGPRLRTEPGTLALCFGYTTDNWIKANAAMKYIYTQTYPVWQEVNRIAHSQLDWKTIPDDLIYFLQAVTGGINQDDDSR